ncbi:hypothetical protein DB32_002727 [Sandaracinus amylolyticus]|uniref:Uncharacterized protein n=1 Tax=Sandaracinus amylolyticus TaxID=927083 RepID=A0A0F6YH73_9BACT|nr:hypothetical protein DB32_002727 [Sandaracinus amylolyticus]
MTSRPAPRAPRRSGSASRTTPRAAATRQTSLDRRSSDTRDAPHEPRPALRVPARRAARAPTGAPRTRATPRTSLDRRSPDARGAPHEPRPALRGHARRPTRASTGAPPDPPPRASRRDLYSFVPCPTK